MELPKYNFLGLSISVFYKYELVNYLHSIVVNNEQSICYGHVLWTFPMMKMHPDIYHYGEQADLFVTDGKPFYSLAKFNGLPLKYNISIPNLVLLTLELANKHNWSIFLLGTKKTINDKAQVKIKADYPGISCISGHHGYFDDKAIQNIVNIINREKPNIVLIGIPSPKKEKLAVEFKNKINSNLIIPCGGMIDVLAGKTKLTPKIIKQLGLASFYRVMQEPKRLLKRYIYIYGFFFFRFVPIYIKEVLIKGNKNYSMPKHYKIINKDYA